MSETVTHPLILRFIYAGTAVAATAGLLSACGSSGGSDEASAIFTMSAEDLPDDVQTAVTPVADGDVLVINSPSSQVLFVATAGDAEILVAAMREITGHDVRLPSSLPDGLVLEVGTAAPRPSLDDTADPIYHRTGLVWSTEPAPLYDVPSRGTQVFLEQLPAPFGINPEQYLIVIAELEGETQILRLDQPAASGEAPPGPYFLMPPEGTDAPAFSLTYLPSPDGPQISEDEIVAMLTSLIE